MTSHWLFERIPGGWSMRAPNLFILGDKDYELAFEVRGLRWKDHDLLGLLSVMTDCSSVRTIDGVVLHGSTNLSSLPAREGLARTLSERTEAVRHDWRGFVEEFAQRVLHEEQDGQGGSGDQPVVTRISEIAARPLEWLWGGRIPMGMVTILDGDPGLGKSLITLDLAARVSTGWPMPDGSGQRSPRGVVILSAEDDPARTIRPRLEAVGADLDRMAMLAIREPDGTLRDPTIGVGDLRALEHAIGEVDAAMVVIDPLMAFLPDSVNANVDHGVRRVLAPLADLAERTGASILAIRHLRKSQADSPLYRGGGSIGIIGAARAGFVVAPDPNDPSGEGRVLAATKQNLAPLPPSLMYKIEVEPRGGQPRIAWGGITDLRAADLLIVPRRVDHDPAQAEATAFLTNLLATGPVLAQAVREAAAEAGLAWRTIERAKVGLGVRSVRLAGFTGPWSWSLGVVPRHGPPYTANVVEMAEYVKHGGVRDQQTTLDWGDEDYGPAPWKTEAESTDPEPVP
jgi:hypothetical protein